ncbi:lipoprotein insertase outer membrane protein LolB [Sutterella sp.]|uniref:lipoprotein insertase outer membrane protein LolB n=1 Tax=Sutterella sp. TaxID=1981025 RepID=UPI003FD8BA50
MTARRTLLTLAALLPFLAAGCAVAPANARRWRGRFAFSAELEGGAERQSGRFELTDSRELLRLDLLTPLSGILARIEETPRGASFSRGGTDEPVVAADLDELLMRLLGFTLPVRELRDLLAAGPAAPDALEADGWRCRILARRADGSAKRLRIERAAGPRMTLTAVTDDDD